MNKLKEFFNSRKGKVISITAAAFIVCIAVLLVVFLNRPVAVQSTGKAIDQYATAVKIDKTALDLKAGDHDTLNAEVTPNNAKDKTVHWASSDKSVATVSDGLITAQGSGTAEITATSINGKQDACSVTVSAPSTASSSTDASSAGNSSTPSNLSENSGSTKPTTPTKGGTATTKPTTKPSTKTKPSTTTDTTTTAKAPVNKEFYITVDGCNIQYNPAYRSIQAFIDVTSINQTYYKDSLNAKIYRNKTYDNSQSGCYASIIGKNRSNVDVAFGVEDKTVNGVLTPIPATFKIVCSHNETEFKTIEFSVDANGIYLIT